MNKIFNTKYDIILIGDNFFSAQLALQLIHTKLKILLISENDFSDNLENNLISISKHNNVVDCKQFYNNYSHSLIPVKVYNIINTNIFDYSLFKLQSFINNEIISNKDFKKTEKSIVINKKTVIKTENKYKVNYSRLCIDTIKTAQQNNVDFVNHTKIKELKTNKIILMSGNIINTDLIINTTQKFSDKKLNTNIKNYNFTNFRVPKHSININNVIRINKNKIDLIPYFSELFICSYQENDIDLIIKNINKSIGLDINKDTIINKKIINSYSANFFTDKQGVINIFESDYTNFEAKINKIIEFVCKKFAKEKYTFSNYKIYNTFSENIDKHYLMRLVEDKYLQIQETGIAPQEFTVLFYRYGKDIDLISEKAYDFYNNKQTREYAWLYAELWYSVNYEFVKTFNDFVERRTNYYLFNQLDSRKKEIITNFIENAK